MNTTTVCRGTKRQLKYLKKGVIPSVFTTVPYSICMKETSIKKELLLLLSYEKRRDVEWIANEQITKAWLASDKFENLEEPQAKGGQ